MNSVGQVTTAADGTLLTATVLLTAQQLHAALSALGVNISQATLSNYVRAGRVDRHHVGTAPGGRGQTGYYPVRAIDQAAQAWRELREKKETREQLFERALREIVSTLESEIHFDEGVVFCAGCMEDAWTALHIAKQALGGN